MKVAKGLFKRRKGEQTMEFTQVIKERYSCKKFNGEKVKKEIIDEILEAGRVAPTAKNLQEQRIYVLESKEALAKFEQVSPCRYGAPTVIIVAFDKNNVYTYPGEKKNSGIEDATIVATHMILAARNAGVDSCWINHMNPEMLEKELGLPENEEILMAMDLGYAEEGTKPLPNHTNRKEIHETVVFM